MSSVYTEKSSYFPSLKALRHRWMTLGLCVFWSFFWLIHGFDLFVAGKDIGFFHWQGLNSEKVFSLYFQALTLPNVYFRPFLVFAGLWQLSLAASFFLTIDALLIRKIGSHDRTYGILILSFFLTLISLAGCIGLDVISGHAENMLKHLVLLGLIGISYIVVMMERMFCDAVS
jgi:hypothetical protein